MPAIQPGQHRRSVIRGFRRSLRSASTRWVALLGLDGTISAASFSVAMLLRFEGSIPEPDRTLLPAFAFLFVGFRILSNLLFRLHRWSFRLSGLTDGARVGMAAAC